MSPLKSKTPKIRSLHEVGRYAIGVQWEDGHDSIYPLENLRRYCPCEVCNGEVQGRILEANQGLRQFSRLGEQAVFIAWADGHETLYTTRQLRDLCGCAYCIGEPERPISGG
jgi:DUF971 family protein